jgi:CheY-like chemotaxis protein
VPEIHPVYVIDDDEAVRESISLLLESRALPVRTFASATEFLGVAPSVPPGCVLTDLRMPVNAGEKMHRRAGVKMHHVRMGGAAAGCAALVQVASPPTQLSSSIKEPAFPSRPGITSATARNEGDGRSGATRSNASMASTGPSPQ